TDKTVTKNLKVDYAGEIAITIDTVSDDIYTGSITLEDTSNPDNSYTVAAVNGTANFTGLPFGTYNITVGGYEAQVQGETITISESDPSASKTIAVDDTVANKEFTLIVTNNSGAERTLVLKGVNNSTPVEITIPAGGYNETIELPVDIYETSCAGASVDNNTFAVTSTTTSVELTLGEVSNDTLKPLAAGTKYDFDTGVGYSETFSLDNGSGDSELISKYYRIVYGDALYFNVEDKSKIVEICHTSKPMVIEINDGSGVWTTVSGSPFASGTDTLTLVPGKYRIKAGETGSSGLKIDYINVLDSDDTNATLTLTVNNNASETVNVSVDGGDAQSVDANTTGKALIFTGLTTGTHTITITSATGAIEYDTKTVEVTKDAKTVTATVNVTASQAPIKVTFKWDKADASPDKAITVTGDVSGSLSTSSNSKTFEVTAGTSHEFRFSSEAKKVTSIDKSGMNGVKLYATNTKTKEERYFKFTIPADAVAGTEYVLTFVCTGNYGQLKDDDKNESSVLVSYGQYGFGANKVSLCGNDARDKFNYVGVYASMYDFTQGYTDSTTGLFADEIIVVDAGERGGDYRYGLVSKASSTSQVKITLSNEIAEDTILKLDVSGSLEIKNENGSAMVAAGSDGNSKKLYKVQRGETYIISGTSTGANGYIKSVRIYNPENIFVKVADTIKTELGLESEISGDLADILGITDGSSSYKVFRLIGKASPTSITTAGSIEKALLDVNEVGWKIIPAEYVDKYNDYAGTNGANYYTPGKGSSWSATGTDVDIKGELMKWEGTAETGNIKTNEIKATSMLNSAVVKMGIDNGDTTNPYDDVYSGPNSGVKEEHLLVGTTTSISGADYHYTDAYAENFIRITGKKYYAFPYTVYVSDPSQKVYNQPTTETTSTSWISDLGVVVLDGTIPSESES
ncbi:MAG: hypothetical protein ACI4VF_07880, partial [Lachnospirales bacterium]